MLTPKRIIVLTVICICAITALAKQNKVDVDDRIQGRLNSRKMDIQQMEMPEDLPEEFTFPVEHDGKLKWLYLQKHSFRGPNFKVLVQDDTGEMVEIDPGPVRTYLGYVLDDDSFYAEQGSFVAEDGTLVGDHDTIVGAVVTDEGLHAAVHSLSQPSWHIAPLKEDEDTEVFQQIPARERHAYAYGKFHAVYDKKELKMPVVDEPTVDPEDPDAPIIMEFGQSIKSFNLPRQVAASAIAVTGQSVTVKQAEIGFEIDYKAYANRYGSSTTSAQNNMNNFMTQNLILWLRDCQVKHVMGVVSIRTSSASCPYNSYTGVDNNLLNQFRNVWNGGSSPSTTHDLAAMHHGGGGGGLAWVGQVCTSYRYALAGANTVDGWRGYMQHEVGHTWSLGHGPGAQELNKSGVQYGIMWSGPHDRFTTDESALVISHRDSRSCLVTASSVQGVAPYGPKDKYWNVWTGTGAVNYDVCANDRDSNNDDFDITAVGFIGGQSAIGTISISYNSGPGGRDQVRYTPPSSIGATTIVNCYYDIKDSTNRSGYGLVDFQIKQGATSVWVELGGAANSVSVDAANPWVINDAHNLYGRSGSSWAYQRSDARDIGCYFGARYYTRYSDDEIFVYSGNGNWSQVGGQARRVDVDSSGRAWVVNSAGNLYRRNSSNTGWDWNRGSVQDVGCGYGGQVYITLTNDTIAKWNGGSSWSTISGLGERIDVGSDGRPWLVNSANNLYRRNSSDTGWDSLRTGDTQDVGCGNVIDTGVVITLTNDKIYRYDP